MAHIIGTVSLNKNVYSLYDIAKFEKISEKKIKSLMTACLTRVRSASPSKTANGMKSFFNEIGASDAAINVFFTHSKLQPFAAAVRMASEKVFAEGKDLYYVAFYVSKDVYHKWKKTGTAYNPDVVPDMSETGLSKCAVSQRTVKVPKIPMFTQFEAVLKSIDIKLSEGILLAVEEYMKRHSDVFGEIIRDNSYSEKLIRENKMSLISAYISPETTNAVYKAIQRYNMLNVCKIKFSDFVDSALCEKLDRLPLQYTDPKLYSEALELQKAEEKLLDTERE